MTIISVLAVIFGTIMALANIPQAFKIFLRKSAKDVCLLTYLILLVGTVSWILYGIEIKSFPLIFANSVGLIAIGLVISGCLLYGRDEKNFKRKKKKRKKRKNA
jgi:MtN3 and saliva related transmembrane protein